MNGSQFGTKIVKKCPVCGWRIFDKITPTSGLIEMKCPSCRQVITVDLSYRSAKRYCRPYRIA